MNNITDMIAEGKGKRLYATENPDEAVVYYRDETFAFHGLKRGRIIGKGEINNLICEYMFTLLTQKGVPNHFIRRIDNRCSLIKRVEIIPVTIKVRNIVAGSLAKRIGYPSQWRRGTKRRNAESAPAAFPATRSWRTRWSTSRTSPPWGLPRLRRWGAWRR